MDIQPTAVRRSRRRVPGAEIRAGNFLLDAPPGPNRYDVIAGNPPYLGQRDVTQLDYAPAVIERYGVKDDLYAYFLYRSLDLLADGGVLAMVTSDSWLTLTGKEPLRRSILRHRLDHVVRLGAGTFPARIHACAFGLIRGAKPDEVRTFEASPQGSCESTFDPGSCRCVRQSVYLKSPRVMVFDPTSTHLKLQRAWGPRLARWQSGRSSAGERSDRTRRGQVVPFEAVARVGDVGIHSRNCRGRLFHADKTRPGLERLLQGRQIERWRVRWDSPNARYRWVDVAYRPRVGVKGVGRGGRPSRRDEYWDWQGDPAIHRLPERILIRQTDDKIVAAYLRQNGTAHYTDNTLFTGLLTETGRALGLTYRYVLGYLNSAAANGVYRFLSQEQSRRQAQVKIGLLRILPFRIPTPSQIARIDAAVARIAEAYHRGRPDAAAPWLADCNAHFEAALSA